MQLNTHLCIPILPGSSCAFRVSMFPLRIRYFYYYFCNQLQQLYWRHFFVQYFTFDHHGQQIYILKTDLKSAVDSSLSPGYLAAALVRHIFHEWAISTCTRAGRNGFKLNSAAVAAIHRKLSWQASLFTITYFHFLIIGRHHQGAGRGVALSLCSI